MASIRISRGAIWVKRIEGNPDLQARIRAMRPGEVLDLEIDGVVGRWERMRDGRDGRPTLGIKPIAETREMWARMRRRPRKVADVREIISADRYLAELTPLLSEWETPQDDAAYSNL
jgi:hypothetical protein